jgi:hypothetical protein
MHQPVRNYPLPPIMEPPVFVLGERKGVKMMPHPSAPSAHMPHPPPPPHQQAPPPYPGAPMSTQAMIAQQNAMMDRHNRERRGMPPVDNRGANMGEVRLFVLSPAPHLSFPLLFKIHRTFPFFVIFC